MRTKRLLISLTNEEHKWLRSAADAQGTTMSELLRRLAQLAERIAAERKPTDELREY